MTLTIEDLRNPALASGFSHVRFENVAGRPKPYCADHLPRGVATHRATAEEAAQDYCDYMNGREAATQEHRVRLAPGRPDLYALPTGKWWRGEERAVAKPRRDALRDAAKTITGKRFAFEKDVEDALAPVVRQLAIELQRSVLCEVKNDTGRQSVATAVGQLKLRQLELWDEGDYPVLAIGVPEPLRPDLSKRLEHMAIRVLVAP